MRNKLTLTIQAIALPGRNIKLNMRLYNNDDVNYFIRSSEFGYLTGHIKVSGPSKVFCYLKINHGESSRSQPALKIGAKSYIDSGDLYLSGSCDFEKVLPGVYTVKHYSITRVYEDENLSQNKKFVGIVGETSFELS